MLRAASWRARFHSPSRFRIRPRHEGASPWLLAVGHITSPTHSWLVAHVLDTHACSSPPYATLRLAAFPGPYTLFLADRCTRSSGAFMNDEACYVDRSWLKCIYNNIKLILNTKLIDSSCTALYLFNTIISNNCSLFFSFSLSLTKMYI